MAKGKKGKYKSIKKGKIKETKWRNLWENIKKNRNNKTLIFIVGAVVSAIITAIISKACNRIVPDPPVVVEKYPDTIVHVFKPSPDSILKLLAHQSKEQIENRQMHQKDKKTSRQQSDHNVKTVGLSLPDTISLTQEKQTERQTENSNNNQIEIGENHEQITSKESANKVFVNANFPNAKGYSTKSSAPYFSLEMSKLDYSFVDFTLDFFNKEVLTEIYCLSLKVCKTTKEGRVLVLDVNYEPKKGQNILRIKNIFSSDDYEVEVGFFLSKDRDKKYPEFYRETKHIHNKKKND